MNSDPKKPGRPPDKKDGEGKQPKTILTMILVALIFTVLINALYEGIANAQYKQITYDEFHHAGRG